MVALESTREELREAEPRWEAAAAQVTSQVPQPLISQCGNLTRKSQTTALPFWELLTLSAVTYINLTHDNAPVALNCYNVINRQNLHTTQDFLVCHTISIIKPSSQEGDLHHLRHLNLSSISLRPESPLNERRISDILKFGWVLTNTRQSIIDQSIWTDLSEAIGNLSLPQSPNLPLNHSSSSFSSPRPRADLSVRRRWQCFLS